jgi:hypothetical protein
MCVCVCMALQSVLNRVKNPRRRSLGQRNPTTMVSLLTICWSSLWQLQTSRAVQSTPPPHDTPTINLLLLPNFPQISLPSNEPNTITQHTNLSSFYAQPRHLSHSLFNCCTSILLSQISAFHLRYLKPNNYILY